MEKQEKEVSVLGQDLNDYLTGEEKKQMDALLTKAEARMKEKGEEGCSGQLLLMACQCNCRQIMQKEEEKERFEEEVRKIFSDICNFCKGHDLCPEYCQDELPFP